MSCVRVNAALGFALAAASASAQSTFFPSMPYAELLGHRECTYCLKAAGNERNVSRATGWCQELSVGVLGRVEVAYDNDFLGGSSMGVKALLFETNNPRDFALAAGLCGIPLDKGRISTYIVGRTNPTDRLRLHFGWLQDTENRLMLGADYDLGKGYSAAIESISGTGHAWWGGFNIPLGTPQLMMTLGVGIPDRHSDGIQNSISIAYGFRI